jgi:hypothetical protein
MKHKNFEYYLNLASNLVLSLFILLGITCAVAVGFFNFGEGLSLNIFLVVVSLTFALAAFLLFFIDPRFKHNISILIFFTYGTLFTANLILERTFFAYVKIMFREEFKSTRVKTDTRTKLDTDTRTKLDTDTRIKIDTDTRTKLDTDTRIKIDNWYTYKLDEVLHLRKTKTRVFPNVAPKLIVDSEILIDESRGKHAVFPLGGISNAHLVLCNEEGPWVSFKSDRYGYNNDDSVYEDNSGGDRIVLLGDSFTQGYCVERKDSVAGQLIARGHNIINLGTGGNGPLIELAVLKEYGVHLKPKYIFWIFNKFDHLDLTLEYKNKFLINYLDDKFSQNLISRQQEIDLFWEHVLVQKEEMELKKVLEEVAVAQKLNIPTINFEKQVRFENVRNKRYKDFKEYLVYFLRICITLGNIRRYLGYTRAYLSDLEPVLMRAKKIADKQGIKLYFVFIPTPDMYSEPYSADKKALAVAQKLNIPTINFEKQVRKEKNNLTMYINKSNFHYNKKGYSLLADSIEKEISN